MHYFQQRYLREVSTFPATAGLLTVDLPNKGLLSGIEMRVWGRPEAGESNPDTWLHDKIKKVELIVNGSQVVKSYDARQLLAMMLYKETPHFMHAMKNVNALSSEEFFYINLGRFYHDLEYMLDLGQVNDPELRLEFDFDLATQNGWTNGKAEDIKPSYSIICHLLRDTELIPKGYIKTSEIHRVDNAASLNYNMTVARGPVYSNLYIQSWYKEKGLGIVLDHVEVNINSDDLIPYRAKVQDMVAQLARKYGLMETSQHFHCQGWQSYPAPLESGVVFGELAAPGPADAGMALPGLWANFFAVAMRIPSTGLGFVGNARVELTYRGGLPFSVAAIPLFDPRDPATWIDSAKLGDFWVRIEEFPVATAGVMKLLADEVVTSYTTPSWP